MPVGIPALAAITHCVGQVLESRYPQVMFQALAIKSDLRMAAQGRISRWSAFIDQRNDLALVEKYRRRLKIRRARSVQLPGNLSCGNQQNVVALWLALGRKVLIVDGQTRSIHGGVKIGVHNLQFEMANTGIAVIDISLELPAILAISDRTVTKHEGRVWFS